MRKTSTTALRSLHCQPYLHRMLGMWFLEVGIFHAVCGTQTAALAGEGKGRDRIQHAGRNMEPPGIGDANLPLTANVYSDVNPIAFSGLGKMCIQLQPKSHIITILMSDEASAFFHMHFT